MNSNRHILKDGTQLQGKNFVYKIVKLLGQGSFGITYLAKVCLKGSLGVIQGNIYVAIKEFYMADVNSRVGTRVDSGTESGLFHAYHSRFQKEALNLAKMDHAGIVKVMEVFDENNTSYMVMEFLPGGTLDDYIKEKNAIPESEAKIIITQVAQALSYMHDRQMLHLDLKPGNIMLKEDKQPVLIDFGLSKHYNDKGIPETSTPIGLGTPGYAPLEQSEYQESDGFQPTMDIYALGATLFKTLTGQAPPTAATVLNKPSLLNDLMVAANVTQPTRDLVLSAMQPIRKVRPQSIQAFLDKMEENPDVEEYDEESTLIENVSDSSPKEQDDIKINQCQSTRQEIEVLSSVDDNIHKNEEALIEVVSCQQQNLQKDDSEFYTLDFNDESKFYLSRIGTRCMGLEDLYIENEKAIIIYKYKWGVVGANGNLILPFLYDSIIINKDGSMSVKENGKWGLINKNGDKLISISYENPLEDIEGYILASIKGKWGVIDINNKNVIPFMYKHLRPYSDGFFAACNEEGLWGYINRVNRIVIPFQYENADSFHNGKARVQSKNNFSLYGIINKDNEIVLPFKFKELHTTFQDGICAGKVYAWELYDEKGNKVINNARFKYIEPFNKGLTIFKNKFCAVLDTKGNIIGPKTLENITRINDMNFHIVEQGKHGIMDGYGNILCPIDFDDMGCFNEGIAYVEKNGKFGFIDENGKEIIPLIYDWVAPKYINGKILVKKGVEHYQIDRNGMVLNTFLGLSIHMNYMYTFRACLNEKFGYIDYRGSTVVPFVYDDIWGDWDGKVFTKANNKIGIFDEYNYKEVVQPYYDYIDDNVNEDCVIVGKGEKIGFINNLGKEIIPLRQTKTNSKTSYLPFKNGIASIDNKFLDKKNHVLKVSNLRITQMYILFSMLFLLATAVLAIAYVNPFGVMSTVERLAGLSKGYTLRYAFSLIGKYGYIILTCISFLGMLCCLIILYIQAHFRAYKPEQMINKTILDNYDDYAYLMTNGLLAVKKDEKWGFINRKGKIIIPLSYDKVSVFKADKAKVESDREEMMINTKGKRIDN